MIFPVLTLQEMIEQQRIQDQQSNQFVPSRILRQRRRQRQRDAQEYRLNTIVGNWTHGWNHIIQAQMGQCYLNVQFLQSMNVPIMQEYRHLLAPVVGAKLERHMLYGGDDKDELIALAPPSKRQCIKPTVNQEQGLPVVEPISQNTVSEQSLSRTNQRPTEASSYCMLKNEKQRLLISHLSMRELKQYYNTKYKQCQREGKAHVSSINTYQGRLSSSTNGCTVISALVVANHLQDHEPFNTISNATIQDIIDNQCGPVLNNIRKTLGLNGYAYIPPSEAHEQTLLQHQFRDVTGGNIMNHEHVKSFLKALSAPDEKAGATLFFQEHVVSIVKSINPLTRKPYYDFIDSLPAMNKHSQLSPATRTRCFNLDTLEVVLMRYATQKLKTNIKYNQWNDYSADSDPRVFQGFVWTAAPTFDDNNEDENTNNIDVINILDFNDDDKEEDKNEQEEGQQQESEIRQIHASTNVDAANVTVVSDADQIPVFNLVDIDDNKKGKHQEQEQEAPSIVPPLPQVRRSQRLANARTLQELPIPPILRRSPRLALMPRVSYVGMC
jgi:hypothetical protein